MENLSIYEAVRYVPENAKKKISGGRMIGKTDINPMWRIKTLTDLFGPCGFGWYYKTINQWLEVFGDEVAAFVQIELFICVDEKWSQPINGIGGSMFAEKEKGGIHVSDECYKMATTDAISVACKQLGIGADVYWEADKTKYTCDDQKDQISDNRKNRLKDVEAELRRTGYTPDSICKTYKINSVYDMSDLQIKDFLQKIKSVKDKAVS